MDSIKTTKKEYFNENKKVFDSKQKKVFNYFN